MHRMKEIVAQPFKALIDFEEQLPKLTLCAEQDPATQTSNASFVRPTKLREWLDAAEIESRCQAKNIERLLEDAFQKVYANVPPYDAAAIMHHCPRVFCMLLEIGKGHLIVDVMRQQITDETLCRYHPKDLDDRLWKAVPDQTTHKEIFECFLQRQWSYCPHIFELNSDYELPGKCVLPIFKRQQINCREWATTTIHQLCIPEEYLDAPMRDRLAEFKFELDDVGTCYYLAVKTFTETGGQNDQARRLFEQERDAYKYLRGQDGMVQYLGAFTCRNAKDQAEHNILLEFGDYDLAEYFLFNPPVLAHNVCNFWYNLFNVASALANLHKFARTRGDEPDFYWGWHADIKPDNILSVKGVLKLTDPGFAGFQKSVHGQAGPHHPIMAMASTYGSPECFSETRVIGEPQAADMWSLGCVLSVAATWLILGPPGVLQYTTLRQNAVKSANQKRQPRKPVQSSVVYNFGNGDYFHNGREVLPEIKQWHNYLQANLRMSDPISAHVLQIIDQGLLRTDPKGRLSAAQLAAEFETIKQRHSVVPQNGLTDAAVWTAVTDIEDQLKDQPAAGVWGQGTNIQSRKALKSSGHLVLPRNDVARITNMFKQRLDAVATKPHLTVITERASGSSHDLEATASPSGMSPIEAPFPPTPSHKLYQQRAYQRPRNFSNASSRTSQNIFDAHYANEMAEKKSEPRKRFRLSLGKRSNAERKDELLSRHYSKRDIKFVIDNGASMTPEWQKVRFVLEKLVKKAAYIDTDGMDLEFANGDGEVKIHEKSMLTEIETAMEKFKPLPDVETDMKAKLGLMLNEWLRAYQAPGSSAKSMTLIVMTDGCWRRMINTKAVEDLIVEFNADFRKVCGAGLLQRHVSIQFISFGDDPDALYRLRYLDDHLGIDKGTADIIDTEHWTGDVYKMLLGSLVPDIDSRDDESHHDGLDIPILRRQDSDTSSRQEDDRYRYQTPTRRERSASALSATSSNPRNEPRALDYHQLHPSATVPQLANSHGSPHENRHLRPVHRDANDYYRYPG